MQINKKIILFGFIIYCLLSIDASRAFAQSVDLLWHGDGYTPPFYKGKTLWSSQSIINLVAMPQGLGDSADLYYKWTKNGTVLGLYNGVGKSTLSFKDSILSRPQTIKVDILSQDLENPKVLASASVYVAPISPSLLVYENNPLYGFLFNRAVTGTFAMSEKEVTFTAFPLFFSVSSYVGDTINYKWLTNAGEAETRSSVTYRVPEGLGGNSEVEAEAVHQDNLLQTAQTNFLIKFGQ